MGSVAKPETKQPHAVCVPYPVQGHINPMLKLAKLLHRRGFHITVVNTDYNHRRLIKSRGPSSVAGTSSFRFHTIPDGLPPSDANVSQDLPSLCESIHRTCLGPFKDLLNNLNASADVPPVSCIVSDGVMSFTLDAAEELGVPEVIFWTTSACGFLAYLHFRDLFDKGLTPLKDKTYLANGYLDTAIDWIPGMKNIRLRDLPSPARTTEPNDFMFNFLSTEAQRARRASAVVLNTFHALERDCLDALSSMLPCPVFSVGSLELLLDQTPQSEDVENIGSNLWKEETECLGWLDAKEPGSVVYVSFGSIAVMTNEQLVEFAWGLADSNKDFLWVIRPDLVAGDSALLSPEFLTATEGRSLFASWCPQVQVLNHPAIGGFLTHCGWNSTLESLCGGVPVICWPVLAEQCTNCRYCCTEWGVGLEIGGDVKREEVEKLVVELMRGKEMKRKAVEWKKMARDAAAHGGGSSQVNLERLISEVLLPKRC